MLQEWCVGLIRERLLGGNPVIIPLLWLVVTLLLHSLDSKSESSQHNSHNKHRDKHKQDGGPRAEARVGFLHNSNRLGEGKLPDNC